MVCTGQRIASIQTKLRNPALKMCIFSKHFFPALNSIANQLNAILIKYNSHNSHYIYVNCRNSKNGKESYWKKFNELLEKKANEYNCDTEEQVHMFNSG